MAGWCRVDVVPGSGGHPRGSAGLSGRVFVARWGMHSGRLNDRCSPAKENWALCEESCVQAISHFSRQSCAEAGVHGKRLRSATLGSRFRGNDEFKCSDAFGDRCVSSAPVERSAAVLLRLGRARLPVLRGVFAAGAGGIDPVGFCRTADPRIRLVAHRALGRGVTRRGAGGDDLTVDRSARRPARVAAALSSRCSRPQRR